MSEPDDEGASAPQASEALVSIPAGSLKRGLKLGAALLGAVGRAAGRRLIGDDADAGGESLAATLGKMKGVSMKLGQMLSYMDLQTPDGWRSPLRRLQQQSVPMQHEIVSRIVEQDLGHPPEVLFAAWHREPLAAASIGQVHQARLHDGTEVAAKVRYPAIDRIVMDDLQNVHLMQRLFGMLAPKLDGEALMAELRERFLEECDYRQEAENQRAFRQFFLAEPGVIVPQVHGAHSAERVLTTELIRGQSFDDFASTASQAERDRAATTIHNFAFKSIFGLGALNCDPHPGNYLFTPEGVAFLDFGCVRRFSPELVHAWRSMVRSALEQDHPRFREAVVQIGLAEAGTRFDFDAHYRQYLYLIRPWLTSEAVTLTPQFVSQTYRALLVGNPNRAQLRMPRELLFANRLQWGLYSVLAQLRPKLSLREPMLDILYERGESRPAPFTDSELERYRVVPGHSG
jgi:predicted unusual protein kinase regulating ubiquinone biosynthesis (AarF/ABC1/UbiB family)